MNIAIPRCKFFPLLVNNFHIAEERASVRVDANGFFRLSARNFNATTLKSARRHSYFVVSHRCPRLGERVAKEVGHGKLCIKQLPAQC